LIFDDTIEHEAWTGSDAPRAVLILGIWNPAISIAERKLVRTTIAGVNDFYVYRCNRASTREKLVATGEQCDLIRWIESGAPAGTRKLFFLIKRKTIEARSLQSMERSVLVT